MKGCAKWQNKVVDCALGRAQNPEFEAHLEACPDCAEAMSESLVAAARINEVLLLRANVEPPSRGPDRVMARIGERNPAGTHLSWRWTLVGCAAAVLLASVLWTRRPLPQPTVSTLASWHSPTEALLQPPVRAAWTTMPSLGEGFFELKSSGEKHAQ